LLGGYWFKHQDLLHMPCPVPIRRPFANTGSRIGLHRAHLRRQQTTWLWSLGWQLQGNIGGVRPYARAAWQYDSLDKDRTVSASSVTLGGWYTIPVAKPDNNYVLFNVGASTEIGGVTGFIAGAATAARGDTNYWALTVGLRVPL
jgi:uncharacterized protein YhjY with autotransporter beta-barrel domain